MMQARTNNFLEISTGGCLFVDKTVCAPPTSCCQSEPELFRPIPGAPRCQRRNNQRCCRYIARDVRPEGVGSKQYNLWKDIKLSPNITVNPLRDHKTILHLNPAWPSLFAVPPPRPYPWRFFLCFWGRTPLPNTSQRMVLEKIFAHMVKINANCYLLMQILCHL